MDKLSAKVVFTVDDLAAYTGWSKSYIYKKTSDGTLKFSKPLGKTVFFSKEWIDQFLLGAQSATSEEIYSEATRFVNLKNAGQ